MRRTTVSHCPLLSPHFLFTPVCHPQNEWIEHHENGTLKTMTVPFLKAALDLEGLDINDKKPDLLTRLEEHAAKNDWRVMSDKGTLQDQKDKAIREFCVSEGIEVKEKGKGKKKKYRKTPELLAALDEKRAKEKVEQNGRRTRHGPVGGSKKKADATSDDNKDGDKKKSADPTLPDNEPVLKSGDIEEESDEEMEDDLFGEEDDDEEEEQTANDANGISAFGGVIPVCVACAYHLCPSPRDCISRIYSYRSFYNISDWLARNRL